MKFAAAVVAVAVVVGSRLALHFRPAEPTPNLSSCNPDVNMLLTHV